MRPQNNTNTSFPNVSPLLQILLILNNLSHVFIFSLLSEGILLTALAILEEYVLTKDQNNYKQPYVLPCVISTFIMIFIMLEYIALFSKHSNLEFFKDWQIRPNLNNFEARPNQPIQKKSKIKVKDQLMTGKIHTRLLAENFTDDEIRDHRTLGFFYDSVVLQIADNPVITNTSEMVDETTANNLIKHKGRLSSGRIKSYSKPTIINNLFNTLVDDAIKEKHDATRNIKMK